MKELNRDRILYCDEPDYLERLLEEYAEEEEDGFPLTAESVRQDGYWDIVEYLNSAPYDRVCVTGELGLWNGRPEIYPEVFDTVEEALQKCFEDYNTVYMEGEDLMVKAIHHDGTNIFRISQYIQEEGYNCHGDDLEYVEMHPFFSRIDRDEIDLKYNLIFSIHRAMRDNQGVHFWFEYKDNSYVCIEPLEEEEGCYPLNVVLTDRIDSLGYPFGDTLYSSVLYPADIKTDDDVASFVAEFLDCIRNLTK